MKDLSRKERDEPVASEVVDNTADNHDDDNTLPARNAGPDGPVDGETEEPDGKHTHGDHTMPQANQSSKTSE